MNGRTFSAMPATPPTFDALDLCRRIIADRQQSCCWPESTIRLSTPSSQQFCLIAFCFQPITNDGPSRVLVCQLRLLSSREEGGSRWLTSNSGGVSIRMTVPQSTRVSDDQVLEPATTAVTALREWLLRQITRTLGLPNAAQGIQDITFCGLSCGLGKIRLAGCYSGRPTQNLDADMYRGNLERNSASSNDPCLLVVCAVFWQSKELRYACLNQRAVSTCRSRAFRLK